MPKLRSIPIAATALRPMSDRRVVAVVADLERADCRAAGAGRFQADRVEEGEALAQLFGAPARRFALASRSRAAPSAHQRFGFAAMEGG